MKTRQLLTILLLTALIPVQAQTQWYNPMDGDEPSLCGRAWNKEIGKTYHRLPERLKGQVTKAVWNNSRFSAGLSVKFLSSTNHISVRYVLAGKGNHLNMAWLNHSGVDLYATDPNGNTHWIGNHMGWKMRGDTVTISYKPLTNNTAYSHRLFFELYLPPYNEVKNLEIGVDKDALFTFVPQSAERPIVVYGTSIVHGASPSRPGLMITNIVSRETGYPIINLGFSGSARMEPGMFKTLAEIDARAYIIDPMPNSFFLTDVTERAVNGVHILRQKSDAPILLVESCNQPDSIFNRTTYNLYRKGDALLRKAYEQLKAEGVKNVFYLPSAEIGLTEDAMIEGTHPNDIGNRQYADAYERKLREMLPEDAADKRFRPVFNFRDKIYNQFERHNAILKLNHETNPEILMIGNSITHFWGGQPESVNNGGKCWQDFFGHRRVVNMGFGWDRIENVYWRIFHGELEGCKPRHICLMIGINNLSNRDKPDDVAAGIIRLAQLIHNRQPQAKIHVIEIIPSRSYMKLVDKTNATLRAQFPQVEGMEIVDLRPMLTKKDSNEPDWSLYLRDGTHPNEKGYRLMAKGLKKHLK